MKTNTSLPVNVRGTVVLASDTREQYREKIARITLDSMVQFVGLLDAEGTVLEINKVALDAVGIKLSDVEGKPFWTTFWWQVSEEINATLRKSIARAAQGEFVRWDTEIYGRAGGKETIIIDASLCPVKDEQGHVVFIAAEGRDITEKKAYEREIARQREELAQLDVLKTQFFANVSHEFRTPLTLMLDPLQEALHDAVSVASPAHKERLEFAYRNSRRLLKLVNSLLDFARIEAGRIEANYEPTDLAAVTTDLAGCFRSAVEQAKLTLTVNCPALPQPVYVDRDMWEKIVLNLLSNAFKFTFEGGIIVTVRSDDRAAVLEVRDTGTGIPNEQLTRIFERFHRVQGTRGRTIEGTGIGLALVKHLVQLHGGSIDVTSEVDRGSVFTVRIPLGTAHLSSTHIRMPRQFASTSTRTDVFVEEALRWLPSEKTVDRNPAHTLLKQDSPPNPHARPARVLVADDNADMREYVTGLLAERFAVEAVSDGEAALVAARHHRPDLILCDVMMPKLDGFGLLREVRNDPSMKSTPVILLSARAGEESRIEGLEHGADDYLIKPFSARELLARVAAHLDLACTRREVEQTLRANEERLQAMFDQATVGIAIVDRAGQFLEVNDRMCDIVARTREDLLQSTCAALTHPDDWHCNVMMMEEVADQQQSSFDIDKRYAKPDGSWVWVHVTVSPLRDRKGNIARLMAVVQDISERKQSEEALRHHHAQFETLLNQAPLGVYLVDADFRIRQVNPTARQLFGDFPDLIGRDLGEVIHCLWEKDQADEIVRIFRHTLDTGEPYITPERIENRLDRGMTEYYEWRIDRIVLPDGRFGVVCYFRDITSQVWARVALRASQAQLETELADTNLLQSISAALIQENDVQTLYDKILDSAVAIMRSDFASMQTVDESQDALRMLVWRGFDQEFGRIFELNRPDTKTSCSVARRTGQRVIVPDVEKCDFIVGTPALEDHRKTGIRAVQSTPLISRSGKLVGMISTHWRNPHQPSERDLRLFDILVRQAADLIERKKAEEELIARSRQQSLLYVLANAVNRAEGLAELYEKALDAIVKSVNADRASILLFDEGGVMRFTAWRGLSDGYRRKVEGHSPWSPNTMDPQPIMIENINDAGLDPELRAVIRDEGIGALGFIPLAYGGRLLGKFMVYFNQPHSMGKESMELAQTIARTLAVGIERIRQEDVLRKNEQRFRTAFQLASVGKAQLDTQTGRFIEVNEEFCRLTGYCREEILTLTPADLTHPDDRLADVEGFGRMLAGERDQYRVEKRYLRKNGTIIWVHVEAALIRDGQGRPYQTVAVILDVTARKQAEDALRRSEERVRLLAETADLLLRSESPQSVVNALCRKVMAFLDCETFFNYLIHPSAGRLHLNACAGIPEEEMARIEWLNLGVAVCGCAALEETRIVAEHIGETGDLRAELVRSYGIQAYACHPLFAQGKVIGTLSFGTRSRAAFSEEDLALMKAIADQVAIAMQRKEGEEALKLSEERQRAFAEQLEQLVDERTHELVQSRDQLRALASELNVAEQRERKRIAAELHDYLAQVLVLARLKLGQMKGVAGVDSKLLPFIGQAENAINEGLAYTRTLVADLCPPVLHDFGLPAALRWLAEHMDRHRLKVTVNVSENELPLPEDQAVLLFQSVRELLINTSKHAGVKEATLRLVQRDGQLHIEVRDQGKGFSPAAAPSMKFGLFSIRERMRALGGTFEIHSAPGSGTTAILTMPLTAVAQPKRHPETSGPSAASGRQNDFMHSALQKSAVIRVLLVDDHAMVRQGLRSVLEGYADIEVVGEAGNGEEAIEQVIQYKPDVVLMDINMPKMNGVEATTRIKSLYPESIIIGLSVQTGGHAQQAILKAGAAMLLTKEAAVDELYQAILNALKRTRDVVRTEAFSAGD